MHLSRDSNLSLSLSLSLSLFLSLAGAGPLTAQFLTTEWQVWEVPGSLRGKAIRPHYVASNQFKDLYLLDDENYWLVVVPGDGSDPRIAGGWGDSNDLFSFPTDIVASPGLDVLVCDNATHRILRFDRKLNFVADMVLPELSPGGVEYPFRVARNALGEIIVATSVTWEVNLFSKNGWPVTTVGNAAYGQDRFSRIEDIGVGRENEVGVVDGGTNTFILLSREGRFIRRVPLPNDGIGALHRWRDRWLMMSREGSLYLLSDSGNAFKKISGGISRAEELFITDCTTLDDVIYAVDAVSGNILMAGLGFLE